MTQHTRNPVAQIRRKARRVWILIAGTAVVLLGVLISPLPGPGLSVLGPVGLAILASEFVWARRLASEIKDRSRPLQEVTRRIAEATPRRAVVPVCATYWGATVPMEVWTAIPSFVLWPAASFLFAPMSLWAYMVFRSHR